MMGELPRVGEVADSMRCHVESILDWSKAGKVPRTLQLGRRALWFKAEIAAFLERAIEATKTA